MSSIRLKVIGATSFFRYNLAFKIFKPVSEVSVFRIRLSSATISQIEIME